MRFFIDTANVEEIKLANDMGVIDGVTTNPSLIAKEGRDYKTVLKEISEIVDGAISGEVKATTEDAEGMIAEGREIAAIHPNMVVKIPMTVEGLKAVNVLSKEGIVSTGDIIACMMYIGMLVYPIRGLGRIIGDFGKAVVAGNRIDEILLFDPLNHSALKEIAKIKISEIVSFSFSSDIFKFTVSV